VAYEARAIFPIAGHDRRILELKTGSPFVEPTVFVTDDQRRFAPSNHARRAEMSVLSTILSKLGIGSASAASTPAPQRMPPPAASPPPATAPPRSPTVDIAAQLEQRAAANPEKLNWRTSIVDLLKLLDMDSSFGARKALAMELGCPADLMGDSAKMNTWLHKTVLARVAANGGKVPQELLH
jgi:hypothetical protein